MLTPPSRILTLDEAAEWLRVPPARMLHLMKKHPELPVHHNGHAPTFDQRALALWVVERYRSRHG